MDNLLLHFNKQMLTHQDKLAFSFYHSKDSIEKITFSELNVCSKQIAYAIQTCFNPQDKLLLIFPPGLELIKHLFACLYAGCTAVLTYPPSGKQAKTKFAHIIEDVKPKAIISTESIIKDLDNIAIPVLSSAHLNSRQQFISDRIKPNSLAIIQYTSGTTNEPKGVMISYKNLAANLKLISNCFNVTEHDIISMWLPPYHDMGLIGGIFTPIFAGASAHLTSPLQFLKNPKLWLELISQHQATITCAPNFGYDYCLRKIDANDINDLNLHSLRCALNGSEPIQHIVLEEFVNKFKAVGFKRNAFCPCYGLAEATLFVAGKPWKNPYQSAIHKNNRVIKTITDAKVESTNNSNIFVSVGMPFQSTKIIDQHTHRPCNEGEIGEIWVAGESVSSGYWNKEKINEITFHNRLLGSNDKYLNTGDLGFLYQNELYICGRTKDLIIIRGKNYYPQDIEYTVSHCHEKLRANYIAAYSSIENGKEEVCIAAELNGQLNSIEYDEIKNAICHTLSLENDLRVNQIYFLAHNHLPKTTSGKIKRQMLAKLIKVKQVNIIYQWRDGEVLQTVDNSFENKNQTIERALLKLLKLPNGSAIPLERNFCELGMDSLLIVEFYHAIQELYPEKIIAIEDFIRCKSLAEVHMLLSEKNTDETLQIENLSDQADIFAKCMQDTGFFSDERKNKDNYYAEPILEGPCDRVMHFKGKELTVWSINDYLGLAGDERIKQACINAIEQYSVAYPMGSRLLTGHTQAHSFLETQLANFVQKESALLCNYGYQGMIGIVSSLLGPDDIIVIDNSAHSCIVDAAKVAVSKKQNIRIFKHNDMEHLESILNKLRSQHRAGILIVTDGVFGMTGDTAPLDKLIKLKKQYHARLLLDDAHGFGVMGENGRGTGEFYQLQHEIDLYFATFAKTMAGIGGFVAGHSSVIDYLKWNSKATIFSKNLPLVYVKSTEMALKIMQDEPHRLQQLRATVKTLQTGLQQLGFDIGKTQSIITPVHLHNIELAEAKNIMRLLREKYYIFVSAVTHPVVEPGKLLIRIIPTFKHTLQDVNALLAAFADIKTFIAESHGAVT